MQCGDANNPGGIGRKKNGDPCTNVVVPGTYRCYMHGGHSPVAKMKAQEALALLRVPAIETIYTSMQTLVKTIESLTADTCAACGFPMGDTEEKEALIKACQQAAKAGQMVLDRTGLGPSSTLEVKQSDGDFDIRLLTDEERGRMMALLTELESIKATVRRRMLNGDTPPADEPVQTIM